MHEVLLVGSFLDLRPSAEEHDQKVVHEGGIVPADPKFAAIRVC